MSFSNKQISVLKGVLVGAAFALCLVVLGAALNPFGSSNSLSLIDRR